MNHGRLVRAISIAVCFIGIAGSAAAAGGGLPGVKQKTLDFKLNLVPYITSAVLAGEADQRLGELNKFTSKLIYGFGTTVSYHNTPSWGLSLSAEYNFKNIPLEQEMTAKGWLFSLGVTYYSRTHVKAIPYARLDAGLVTAKLSDYFEDGDLKLGTHPFLRLGFGMLTIMSSSLNTRFELYYKIAFSSRHDLDQLGGGDIGFDGKCVGLEVGVGFPLLSR